MPLTTLHVLNVCKVGTDTQCKYLHEDDLDINMYHCLKLSGQRKYIDEFKPTRQDSNNHNRNVTDYSKNDNCAGYPILRDLEVGYDKK
jgi:hypothetical protein